MTDFHASFSILGEVIEMLCLQKPTKRLLIDISASPIPDQAVPEFVYRTSFSTTDTQLISEIRDQISPGDIIEAKGSFWQSGFVPHRMGYIDTTFSLSGFRLIKKQPPPTFRCNPYHSLLSSRGVH